MPEETEQAVLDGIIDIEPPLLPIETGAESILLIISVLLLIAFTTYFIIRQRTLRTRARKQLNHLRKAYAHQSIDTRTAAFRLASALRIGLKLQQLSAQTTTPSHLHKHRQRWQTFIEHLDALRYTEYEQSEENVIALFKEADYWLRHWR